MTKVNKADNCTGWLLKCNEKGFLPFCGVLCGALRIQNQ